MTLSIRWKFILLSSLTIVALVIPGIMFFSFNVSQQASIETLIDKDLTELDESNNFSRELLGVQANLAQLINRTNAGGFDEKMLADMTLALTESLKKLSADGAKMAQLGLLDANIIETLQVFSTDVQTSIESVAFDPAYATISAESAWEKYTTIKGALDQFFLNRHDEILSKKLNAESEFASTNVIQFFILAGAACINLFLSMVMARFILKPLGIVAKVLKN